MLGINDYRQPSMARYQLKAGVTHDGMPFAVGDRVMDDYGRIGNIASISSWQRNANGTLEDYVVIIRFPWDSDAYGLERIATKGEFALVDADGNHTQDC